MLYGPCSHVYTWGDKMLSIILNGRWSSAKVDTRLYLARMGIYKESPRNCDRKVKNLKRLIRRFKRQEDLK